METILLRPFQDICETMYMEHDNTHLSKTPYPIHPIRKMWHQMFPPSISRLCQEIALDGRYVNYKILLDTKTEKSHIPEWMEAVDYLGREEFLKKIQTMRHSRVAHTETIKLDGFSTGLVCWSCAKAKPWSSILHLTCSLILIY